MTPPLPTRTPNNLLLRLHKCLQGTHTLGGRGAVADSGEGCDAVVYYDSDLVLGFVRAGEDWVEGVSFV